MKARHHIGFACASSFRCCAHLCFFDLWPYNSATREDPRRFENTTWWAKQTRPLQGIYDLYTKEKQLRRTMKIPLDNTLYLGLCGFQFCGQQLKEIAIIESNWFYQKLRSRVWKNRGWVIRNVSEKIVVSLCVFQNTLSALQQSCCAVEIYPE